MGTQTQRPNGTTTLATGWSLTGAATLHAATNDNSDASYGESAGATAGVCVVRFPAYTLPALAIVKSLTPRYRFLHNVTPGLSNGLGGALPGETFPVDYIKGTTGFATYSGASRVSRPAGGAWTQADLNALTLSFSSTKFSSWINSKVAELYLDIVYNEAPVAAVTAPTGTSTLSSAPPVTWTYTDPESDAQERYQVKIFSAAQYGIGGFDPETSPYTWWSGEVLSAALTATPTPIANATYRAYVKVADVGSSGRYGAWAFSGFVVNVTAPPTPTLVATADTALSRVKLEATVGTYATAPQKVIVERSVDAGTNWVQVRGAFEIVTASLGTFTVWDYEMPRGVVVSYRARVVSDLTGERVVSANSTTATATLAVAGWWLKDPQFPALNMLIEVAPPFPLRRRIPQTTYEGLGSTTATVVTDGARGYAGTLTVWSKTAERWAKLDTLIDSARPLLLEDVLGRAWYIQIGDASEWAIGRAAPIVGETSPIRHFHTVVLPWTQVAAPPGVLQGAGTPTG